MKAKCFGSTKHFFLQKNLRLFNFPDHIEDKSLPPFILQISKAVWLTLSVIFPSLVDIPYQP